MDKKSMRAAIELHRPVRYDRWGRVTTDPAQISEKHGARCVECRESVGPEGCQTWKVANS